MAATIDELPEADIRELVRLALSVLRDSDRALFSVYQGMTDDGRELARRFIGGVMEEVYFAVLRPVFKSHPHLLPDGLF